MRTLSRRTSHLHLLARLATISVLLAVLAGPVMISTGAAALAPAPVLSLTPGEALPGTTIVAEGSGFPKRTTGQLVLRPGEVFLADLTTQPSGAVSTTFIVPDLPPGAYSVVALVGDITVEAPFQITTAPTPTPEPTATTEPTATVTQTPVSPTATQTVTATATATQTATATATASTTVRSFTPAADGRVEEANPSTAYGTDPTLTVDQSPATETYVRFTVSDLAGPVRSAKLRFYATSSTSNGPALYATGTSWTESGLTWATKPARTGTALGDLGTISGGTWVEYDVTSLVTADGAYAFGLVGTSSDGGDFAARETSSTRPQLLLSLGEGTSTPTATAKATTTATPQPSTSGRIFYVDSLGGSDANAGTSETTAWKSLAKANSASLVAGDRLLFKRGQSWTGSLKVAASGTRSAPIVIGAYGTGNSPIIQGASSCVVLAGSFLTLREIQVDNCSWAGIDVSGSSNFIENNLITHNAAGVHVRSGATSNRILSNEIKDNNRMSVLTQGGDDDSGAFGILLQGASTEVASNTISGSDAFSYDYGRDGSAIEVYGGMNNYIHHNLATDNQTFVELGNAKSADNTFAYNVVRSSLASSIFIVTRGAGSGWGPVMRTKLYHNTVVLTGSSSQGFICHAGCSPDILTMRNNIIQAVAKVGYADAPFDEDYNLYNGGPLQFTKGSHSVIANPAFTNPSGGDFHLRSGSPAIDRGVDVGYSQDFDGAGVPTDGNGDGAATPDFGAFEYQG